MKLIYVFIAVILGGRCVAQTSPGQAAFYARPELHLVQAVMWHLADHPKEQVFPDRKDLPSGRPSGPSTGPVLPSPSTRALPHVPISVPQGVYEMGIMAIIERDGTIREAKVVVPSKSSVVDAACLDAVTHWKGKAPTVEGTPIAAVLNLPIRLVLHPNG